MEKFGNYKIPDIRVGGFGPLFSVIFILTGIGTLYIILKFIKQKKWNFLIPYSIIIGITAILIIALDGNYWARYIPYFYAVPLLVVTNLLWEKNNKIRFCIGTLISVILMINVFLVAQTNIIEVKKNDEYIGKRLNEFINHYNNNTSVEIKLNHMGLQGVLYNLDDLKIKEYVINQEKETTKDGYFFTY